MNRQKNIFICSMLLMLNSMLHATSGLTLVTSKEFAKGTILSLDWHTVTSSDTPFIAYVGNNHGNHDIRIAKLEHGTDLNIVSKSHIAGSGGRGWANATAWTDNGPRHLAVGGFNNDKGHELRIYDYNNSHLQQKVAEDMTEVFALDWLRVSGTSYLAVGGFDDNNGREIRVYEYNDNEIMTLRSTGTFFHGQANSVKWFTDNSNNIYLAVGGFEIGDSINSNVRIYSFDTTTKMITLLTTKSFDFFPAYSVSWSTDGSTIYLAACGYDGSGTSQIRIFSFNGSSLSYITTQGFNYGTVYASDWILYNNTLYFAVAGDNAENGREVRVYSFDGSVLTLLTSLNLGFAIPHTLEWQFVDGIPHLAIGSNGHPQALQLYSFSV